MGNSLGCDAKDVKKEPVEDVSAAGTPAEAAAPADAAAPAEPAAEAKEEEPAAEAAPEEPPKLTISIVGARGLRNADWMPGAGKSDCFCVVQAKGKSDSGSVAELHRTKVINDTLEPVWKEEFGVTEYTAGDSLEFVVYDSDVADAKDLLGKVTLDSATFDPSGFNGELKLEEAGKGISAFLRLKVRMAGQECYPPGPPSELTIKVERAPKKLAGLDLDSQDGVFAYVNAVKAGPFKTYNESAKPSEHLKSGDFIVKVNEVEGSAAKIIDEIKKATTLELLVRRPEEVVALIAKKEPKTPHGLEFPKKPTGNALLITKVADGPVQEWSAANEGKEVRIGDRIVAVGPFRGKATDLAKKLAAAKQCQVTIVRPACPKSSWFFW